jgi:hypothetical protein
MQESDAIMAEGSEATAPARPTAPRPPQRTRDPIVRALVIAILAVVILGLGAVLSALVFGLFNTTGAPRTAVERDLVQFTGKVDSGKAKGEVIAAYVDTLMRAGQLSKAKATLDQAMQATKPDRSFLLAQQAKLYAVEKQYEEAAEFADKAMAEAEKELKVFKKKNVENNRREDAGAVMPASYETAALVKAEALVVKKDYAGAIKAYDAYLKYSAADSDILVLRAQAKIKTADKKGAEADYKAALKYIPDYQPALDGLKKIGASK